MVNGARTARLLASRPSDAEIRELLRAQSAEAFTYDAVGATATGPPEGWTVDHNRIELGRGEEVFARARSAVERWAMFPGGWVSLCWPDAPIETGTTVGVLATTLGLWTVSACRIVHPIEDTVEDGEGNEVDRFGLAYGTLPHHVARGEERFLVEWDRRRDVVSYDVLAFSKPSAWFTRVVRPYMRVCQRRFGRDSKRAMVRAVAGA